MESEVRESIKVQSLIARIGAKMGLRIWIPKSDRGLVLQEWKAGDKELLGVLPLNYDEPTLRTIEQIDVLWLKKRSIVRASKSNTQPRADSPGVLTPDPLTVGACSTCTVA